MTWNSDTKTLTPMSCSYKHILGTKTGSKSPVSEAKNIWLICFSPSAVRHCLPTLGYPFR